MIELAMQILSCSQKELASKLSVSPTQITKWKKGEYMSFEMENKVRELLDIGSLDPDVILAFGSIENAKKWQGIIAYLAYLAESANDNGETGFYIAPLVDEPDLVLSNLVNSLKELEYSFPLSFPSELENKDENYLDWSDEFIEEIYNNEFCSLIYDIFRSFVDIYSFYAAYITELYSQSSIDDFDELIINIETRLLSLAIVKADTNLQQLNKFQRFRLDIEKDYKEWIHQLKLYAFKSNIPLRAELMHLIDDEHDSLGVEAEKECLGINDDRLHPDIYMNELLVGMRLIHQVLPVILDKLEIKDFKIDDKSLNKF
ncbi:hypothetical protein [Mannheimia granulomatis]|uniref:hypothetical protein n=1 Tax=Mannheimia granulomatis TaxID=85402 RepID=UPI0004794E65|nr:hypothetical protein [Mannheimia granulomatis]